MKRGKFPDPKINNLLEAIFLKRVGLILACLATVVLAGAAAFAVGHEVGHVSGGYDPNLGINATLLSSGDVEPLPSDHEYIGKPISLEGTWEILGGFHAFGGIHTTSVGYLDGVSEATKLLVYNLDSDCWDEAPAGGLTEGDFPFAIEDNGPYDADETPGLVAAYFIAIKPFSENPSGGGGGGGGCSAGFLAPAALLLLAPLFLLRRRG